MCGSDGKTYPNSCVFENAKKCDDSSLTPKHPGECESPKGKLHFISKYSRYYHFILDYLISCIINSANYLKVSLRKVANVRP